MEYPWASERLLKPEIDNSEDASEDHDNSPVFEHKLRRRRLVQALMWRASLVALVVSMTANVVMWYNNVNFNMDTACSIHTSQSITPMLADVHVEYSTVEFNGTFAKQTIYRQSPSPEVDQAWEALGTLYRPFILQEGEEAEKAGIHPGLMKRPPEHGGGFLVQMEGMHHLHCLNLLRQTSHWNYDYYSKLGRGAFQNSEPALHSHTGHCMDILRQQLMCNVDFNVFGQVWVDNINQPFPDFMTKHKCKNFDAIRQWAHDHQVTEADMKDSMALMWRKGDIKEPGIP